MSRDSHNRGQKDGGKFVDKAKEHPVSHRIDPFYNPKPHKSGDDEYNKGVDKGIKDKGGKD